MESLNMVNKKIKRRALLIGYSGYDIPNGKPLHGVKHDIENMKEFLRSPRGGGWKQSKNTRGNEITIEAHMNHEAYNERTFAIIDKWLK